MKSIDDKYMNGVSTEKFISQSQEKKAVTVAAGGSSWVGCVGDVRHRGRGSGFRV